MRAFDTRIDRNKSQSGFTLAELLVSVIVIGIVAVVIAPTFSSLTTAQRSVYIEKHKLNNQMIGSGLLNYAATVSALGNLPAPYTGSGYVSTVYNPAAPASGLLLKQSLAQTGINPAEINDDGTAAANVRVYQRVSGLTKTEPLYFQSGALVTLTYDVGVIYMTACPKASTTCNPTVATGVPGTSPALTSTNYITWVPTGTDIPVANNISTLPLQKQMLGTTVQRLDRVRDGLLSFLRESQRTAAAGDGTNFYPSGSVSKGGATPGTNQGCRDGWYNLATDTVLAQVGMGATEFGSTAWGGAIEFCRDYDPTASKAANASPHYAAIRILGSVSTGGNPDAVVTGNNVVLTF